MMIRSKRLFLSAVCLLGFCAPVRARSEGAATISIKADVPGAVVSSNLFGVFFEEINFAGEGGIYAEMVRNRSLANSSNPDYWTLITQGTASGQIKVDATRPLNTNILQSLKLTMQSGTGSVGAANNGFWGMSLLAGSNYLLSFNACSSNGFSGPLTARLQSADGSRIYATASFTGLTANWQHYTATLAATGTDTNARLVLSIAQPATVWLDVVSLFPQATFNNRANGLRSDLAGMIAAMKPAFMRYPGGNFIEGGNLTNAVRWKKTIGDIAQRPGHHNDSWGYWSTDGFGLQEYLQFCEDTGMQPLYGINCGLSLGWNGDTNNTVPLNQMGPWVQDALDLIQYANGATSTYWGAQRAANGHPAPFNLQYLEIGNENGGSFYNDRYALFYDAIKSNYPEVHLIACDWGAIPSSRPVEIQDEHYYSSAAAFVSYATKYDSYSRSGPKVFVGEYAVTSGSGTLGNLSAALGEAAFMTGMERNSDVVLMASYAPLFANVNGVQWQPDSLYYDNHRLAVTPSHYVQRLFSQNRGDDVLPTQVQVTAAPTNSAPTGAIGVGSWSTAVEYTNVVVTSNGVTLYQSDFVHNGTAGWQVYNGSWGVSNGLYLQSSSTTLDCRSTTGNTNWANYTISLQARKLSGNEGFLILFNWLDDNDWTWWNVGGWNNTLDGIEQMAGGAKTTLAQVAQSPIQTSQWYNIQIVLTGPRIQCYLNGTLMQDYTYAAATAGVLASSTYSKSSGQVIVKTVNTSGSAIATTFNVGGVGSVAPTATLIQIASGSASDENSLANPTNVMTITNLLGNAGTNFTIVLPANSLSILRLQAGAILNFTNLALVCPNSLTVGQVVATTVWGYKIGSANPWNLTANTNHAITWASGDNAVATVDINGNITATGAGTTTISAAYNSLGLSATQMVQVTGEHNSLVHRYSFNDPTGSTTVADSVGGPSWNGVLPKGGTFGGGRLALSSANQQFVQLPQGILSNYAAVTIEAWVSFPGQLPGNCFFYGFGNSSGNSGENYIFCAPQGGRIAITDGNYAGEQNAGSGTDFSFQTNLHLVAIYDPPAGSLALYTNGALAAVNAGVTLPMSVVNDIYSYIGRSLYPPDPYPDLILDEFRIYAGPLHPNEIAATQGLGPDQLLTGSNPAMQVSSGGGSLVLSWPLAAASFSVQSCSNLSLGNWVTVSSPKPAIVGNRWQITLPFSEGQQYFRLMGN